MRILVTGVGGFIGSQLARRLLAERHEVIGVDDFSAGYRHNVPAGTELIEGDLARAATIAALPRNCALILHLAGQSSGEISFDDPVADLQKNVVTTLNLIRYGVENACQRLVYASSMSVYGDVRDVPVPESSECRPLSCYGVGKLAAEGYLRVYARKLPFVALRMFNVYGPGQDMQNLRQGMVSIFLAQALESGRVHVKGSLERYRDFVYIDDVVEGWCRAALAPAAANQMLNLGTGARTTVAQLLERMRDHVPDMTWFVEGATPGDQAGIYADTAHLGNVLGLTRFTALDAGMKRFVQWAREHTAVGASHRPRGR
ncbi:MAG: NAD-dependent epimerase/dehydratase family protein [Betaproteobacteria bacterium]|nr:NAD-dependent epimerase/dehydratase family protein [Betaproteobacteria bacterium]